MINQSWILKAVISGNFELLFDETVQSSYPPEPSIQRISIEPEFDDKDNQIGKFHLEIEFNLQSDENNPQNSIVADHGRYLLNYYLGLLTFLSGQLVDLVKPPELFYHYPETNKTRFITFPTQQTVLIPPIKLSNSLVFSIQIDDQLWEVMYLLYQGLKQKDLVSSYVLMFSSLELLANLFDVDVSIIDKCENCGYEKRSRPGTKKRIELLLTEKLGYSQDQFKDLWKARNDISHGGFGRVEANRRNLYGLRSTLYTALVRGIKRKLNLSEKQLPLDVPPFNEFTDPILDIIYEEPKQT